jgi:two-component system phosphate regulon sensor histidine kinase PhoR
MEPSEQDSPPRQLTDPPNQVGTPSRGLRLWNAVFPEPLGVALVATLMVGLGGLSLYAHFVLQDQRQEARASEGQAVTNVLAAALGHFTQHDDALAAQTLRQLCEKNRAVLMAEWVRADGSVRCRWPGAAGQESTSAPKPNADGAGASAGAPLSFSAPIEAPGGGPAGTLRLVAAFREPLVPLSALLRGCAAAAAVMLLAYLLLYRRLRRHLRPMDAIQRNLESYAAGVEKEFVALSLSDSLGHIAQSWNHLIEQLAEMRDQDSETAASDLAGDALRRFESRTLRSTLDRLPIGLLRFGQDQIVTYANLAASRLLGHPTETLVGKLLVDVLEEEVRAPLVGAFARSTPTMSVDRKRGPEEQQSTLRFSLIAAAASSPDREALMTIEDVSHLQEADRARDNFLYHVTHELRTPLTNIQAYAETLTGPDFDDEQTRRECYNVIISETRRLSRLIEDILNISQLEVGTARITMREVDLVRLMRQIVQDHLGAADEKQIDLTLKLPPKIPKVRGDKERLSVLVTNLIGNAIKYTPQGGHVTVTLEVGERCVDVAVTDTGIGIAPADQNHVFDKFYRATSEEVQTVKGTGLGLAIAREVARLHGGDIRLESTLSKGSTFVVELPHCGTDD